MSDHLNLRDLHYFEAIADAGHLGRAARALHRSQPTLTGAIRRIEARLGVALFMRAGRGIKLTEAGEALHDRARSLRLAAEDTEREVVDVGRGHAGLVRIGMVPTAARFLMPRLFSEVLRESPGIAFRATIANNDVLQASLKSGELDFTVNLAVPADDEIVVHKILQDECIVVASRTHPIFKRKTKIMVGDLARYGWVLGGPRVATREWLAATFRNHNLPPPKVRIETNQILFLPMLIEENELLSFISRKHLTPEHNLRAVKLRETTWRRDFALCFRRHGYLSPAANRMIEKLRTRAEALFDGRH
jgi:DNA-binding transcriptional LysR family regulator